MGITFTEQTMSVKDLNDLTYIDYFDRLKLLSMSMFEWSGLPDSISKRFLEKTLFQQGKAVFCDASKRGLGLLCLPGTVSGQLNVYGEPINMMVHGVNFAENYTLDECVLIKNNYLLKPTIYTIQLYAQRLYEVERSIDTNIKGQKFPRLIKGSERQQLTLKNIYNQYDGNAPVIYIDTSLNKDAFTVLNTETPYVADKLLQYKHDLWNECLSFLGINNANTDKKERLITDEVESNNQQIQLSADIMLMCRKEAALEINEMFGLNVSVEIRGNQDNIIDSFSSESQGGTNE